jgi:hypothetical protein
MNTHDALNDADNIQKIVDYIKHYIETEDLPDNQLGEPDYVKPLITSFEQIKEIAEARQAKLQEYSNFMNGSNRGGRRRKTRKVQKSRRRRT